jgi:hypothetical protein
MSVVFLFRLAGYGLLILTLFDVVSALVPPQFSNNAWQFQTAGGFVERSAVPLIGFVMAFYGNNEARKKREMLVLRLLSWIALLTGVFYLILLVILFVNVPGLSDNAQSQINAQYNPEITRLQQIQAQVDKATPAQIDTLMKSNKAVTITDPQIFKSKLLQDAATAEKNLKDRATITKNDQKLALIKNAVKWGLGALVSAVLFIRIWAATGWARQ